MMKKVISLLLAGVLILSMTACNKKEEPEEIKEIQTSEAETTEKETTTETEEETTATEEETTATEEEMTETEEETSEPEEEAQIVGGWTLNDLFPATEMTEEEMSRFAKAVEGFDGVGYEPIACLGQQVVAGTNYAYLCAGTMVIPNAAPSLFIVKVYEDLEGTVSILDTEKAETEDLLELFDEEETEDDDDGENDEDDGMLAGGWQVSENLSGVILPEGASEVFAEATEGLMGASYEAIALVGSQVAAGSNYLIIAKQTMVINPPKQSICVMKIYSPIDGSTPTITDVKNWEYWDIDADDEPEDESEDEPEEEAQIVGGWTLNDLFPAAEMTEEEMSRFAKAVEGFDGVGYEPIACLGQQVVAGTNYAYLCTGTMVIPNAVPSLYIVKVYEDLEGTVSILDTEKAETEDLLELFDEEETEDDDDSENEEDDGMLAGGWQVSENLSGVILPEGASEAFAEATEGLTGASYEAIALVGSQVAAGSNYLIIAKQTMVINPPKQSICVMKIYSPIDGSTPTITDVKDWEYWD